jgi:hypothetical protein
VGPVGTVQAIKVVSARRFLREVSFLYDPQNAGIPANYFLHTWQNTMMRIRGYLKDGALRLLPALCGNGSRVENGTTSLC